MLAPLNPRSESQNDAGLFEAQDSASRVWDNLLGLSAKMTEIAIKHTIYTTVVECHSRGQDCLWKGQLRKNTTTSS